MAKRFTDTEKWERPWFRKLPYAYRELWGFVLDKCDIAGVWYVDMESACFATGHNLNYEAATEFLAKQIIPFASDTKWFVEAFIDFQYGELSEACKPHLAVLRLMKKHGIDTLWKGYPKGMDTLQDKDKDKDKDVFVVKEKGGVGEETDPDAPGPEDLVSLWNKIAHANLPRVVLLTEARKCKAQARLKDHPEKTFWDELMAKVNRSPLLSGQEGTWRCSFDWILEPANMVKIVEGNYEPGIRR